MIRSVLGCAAVMFLAPGAWAQAPAPPQAEVSAEEIARLEAEVASRSASCPTYVRLAGLYQARGDFELALTTMRGCTALTPEDPQAFVAVAAFLWDKLSRDSRLAEADKRRYIEDGIRELDTALALQPELLEALAHKERLLRFQAKLEKDPDSRRALTAEANALRARAVELTRERAKAADESASGLPPGEQPVRVGGNIRPPTKIEHVEAVYPETARAARVQGLVILEATIGKDGAVTDAKILRSIPLLDQAALDAVRRWKYEPVLLKGEPVPVIMTVTVSFNLR